MPCNSDHMNARPNETLSRETAVLIVYLNGRLGYVTEGWIEEAAKEYYGNEGRVDEIVATLCATMTSLDETQVNEIVYDGSNPLSRKLADWWDEHQEADAAREEAEAKAAAYVMAEQTIDPVALKAAVEKLQSYTFKPGIESTLFRLKGPEVAARLAAAAKAS